MIIEAIKNINLTLLFSVPIQQLLISKGEILNLIGEKKSEAHYQFLEYPNIKMVNSPEKEFVFESNRILFNDNIGDIDKTQIPSDLQKLVNSPIVENEKIIAYGLNYDAIIKPDKNELKIDDLVSLKISKISNIKNIGVSLEYEIEGVLYTLDIRSINLLEKDKQTLFAHFNAHFNSTNIPDEKGIKDLIDNQSKAFKEVIAKI